MSSPNYIGIKRGVAHYYVYCHGGQHLSENGRMLYEHYNTTEKVEQLLKKGGMSYLEKTPDKIPYYRDRETGRSHHVSTSGTWSTDRYNRPHCADGGAPCYLWDGTEWLYSPESDEVWVPLATVFQHPVNWH